jgi:hypothetical protein
MSKQILENQRKMDELEKLGDTYYIMLGDLVMRGKPIQESIDACYDRLIKKNALNSLIEEMKKPFDRKKI